MEKLLNEIKRFDAAHSFVCRTRKFALCLLICATGLSGCRGTSYEYVNEDSRIRSRIKIPAGSAAADLEFTIVTNYALPLIESDYPTISVHYSSDARVADKLKKLEIRLLVDDQEAAADETAHSASHFHRTIDFAETECCADLGQKLGIGAQKSDFEYPFGVHIVKKYKSLKRLPERLTVVVSATTDKGTIETTRGFSLKAYEDRNFIRVH